MRIAATYYIYNAVEYDYPIVPSIRSLRQMVDEIVVLDCGSTDGTKELLSKEGVIMKDAPEWKVDRGEVNKRDWFYTELARSYVDADWYIRMDADEILVEMYRGYLRNAVELINEIKPIKHIGCERLNFYFNPKRYIKPDLKTPPCGPYQYRVDRKGSKCVGDSMNYDHIPDGADVPWKMFRLFHYGFIRKPKALIEKAKEYMTLSYGSHGVKDDIYKPEDYYSLDDTLEFNEGHPVEIQEWLKERHGNS